MKTNNYRYGPQASVGDEFGQWVVISEANKKHNQKRLLCRCSCGTTKEVAQTHLINGNSTCCLKCSGKKNSTRGKNRRTSERGRWLYGWGLQEQFWAGAKKEQFDLQNGICPLCAKPLPEDPFYWCWDHDHKTDECRGILHRGCNVFLGQIENYPGIETRAKLYLEKYK